MVVLPPAHKLTRLLPALPTGAGIAAGLAAALAIMALPGAALEQLVWRSGIAALLPAAQSPLGAIVRLCIGLGAGVVAGAVCRAALSLVFGPGGVPSRKLGEDAPTVRRADAHPDAPPRRPMTAADLGAPFMEVPASPASPPIAPIVRSLPADLDQPLVAFDSAATPATPRVPSRPPAPLAPGEWLNTFVLAPPPPSVAPTRRDPASPPSIDALLRRLEEGAAHLSGTTGATRAA